MGSIRRSSTITVSSRTFVTRSTSFQCLLEIWNAKDSRPRSGLDFEARKVRAATCGQQLRAENANMNFTYQGFTQNDGKRCFTFWSTRTENNPISIFSIEVDLPLLSRIRVPVQEAPLFCLHMLNMASLAGLEFLDRLHSYQLVE